MPAVRQERPKVEAEVLIAMRWVGDDRERPRACVDGPSIADREVLRHVRERHDLAEVEVHLGHRAHARLESRRQLVSQYVSSGRMPKMQS